MKRKRVLAHWPLLETPGSQGKQVGVRGTPTSDLTKNQTPPSPQLVRLTPLYYVYMSLLSTFSTNSTNILAGINDSEVSQAIIIAISVIVNDLLYLPWPIDWRIPLHLTGN